MKRQLEQINDWEKLACEAKFRPADMAALCLTSLRQLQRFFRARFHQTPGKWTREVRCRLARQLVTEGWSCKAIVIDLGFVDHSHLCHEFRNFYGVNPRGLAPQWRERAQVLRPVATAANDAQPERTQRTSLARAGYFNAFSATNVLSGRSPGSASSLET